MSERNKRTKVKIDYNNKGSFNCCIELKDIPITPLYILVNALNGIIRERAGVSDTPDLKDLKSIGQYQSFIRLLEMKDELKTEIVQKFPMWQHVIDPD